ncbi:hypothetical protein AMET1_1017 [Methanonatronarchaeum thermophilum]|uniref:Uncharacterized protein n=1 Tax=Methanonatronarchaeum thermophilum TaxID=1927129 RepID=A0A1Y3GF78_9EURY|nr:hypothetical protein AMET1_1017 [Methanonatronarchaeum thermophilum]
MVFRAKNPKPHTTTKPIPEQLGTNTKSLHTYKTFPTNPTKQPNTTSNTNTQPTKTHQPNKHTQLIYSNTTKKNFWKNTTHPTITQKHKKHQ